MISGYNYKRQITLDYTKFPSTLTDFPVLVKLTESNFDFSKILTSGGLDVRFTLDDQDTLLKFEREFYGVLPSTYGSDFTTGGTASSDSDNGGEVAANAFDKNTGTFWTCNTGAAMPHWIKYDLGVGITKIASRFTLMARTADASGRPLDFKLQGSNDDSNWDDLHSETGITWADDGPKTYDFSNSTAYRYYRLYITNSSGGTYVQVRELTIHESLPTQQAAFFWVKIPSVSSSVDTNIYMFYGKSGDSDGQDAPNTWDSYHKAVYHLKETGNGTVDEYIDSKGSYDGRGGNGDSAKTPAPSILIYEGQLFDGSNDFIQIADEANLELGSSDFTISFKVKFTSTGGNQCFLGRATSGSSYFYFAREGGTLRFRDYNSGDIFTLNPGWSPTAGVIYDIEATRNGTTWTLFIDGSSIGSTTSSASLINRAEGWQIGANTAISYYTKGVMDEVRFSIGLDRGANWRTARINSDNDDVNTIGAEQTTDTLSTGDTLTLNENWELTLNPNPLDLNETISISENWSIEESPKFEILNENITLSESWNFLRLVYKFINTKLDWKKLYTNAIKTILNWTLAKTINTSLIWLGVYSKAINTDLRWLSIGYNDVPPIAPSDIQILLNGVDMVIANDVDIQSGNIQHTIGQKSTATFRLARKHDDLDRTHTGVASQITNQNPVQIYIQGHLEFDGKISNLAVNSETETVQVTCLMNEPAQNRHTIDIPLPSVNEKIHLYHCLINNVQIDNPYIDPGEENPQFYSGIKVDLGTKIQQQTDTWRDLEYIFNGKGIIAASIEDGTFIPKPNYNYFWNVLVKNVRTGISNGDFRYIGTSLGPVATDLWVLIGASPLRQKIKDNIETVLGYYYVGTAPYKEISSKNGQLIISAKYEDRDDGLYHVYPEAYNYIDFTKLVAGLEYQKLLNINGQILPITSANIDITFDAYYYYTVKLLTRINVTNTTVANTFKNNNGFPTSVKGITINFSSMKITLTTDNRLSQDEIDEIDTQMPNEENPIYLVPEHAVRVYRKFDLKTWSYVS